MSKITNYLRLAQYALFCVCTVSFFQLLMLFEKPNEHKYSKENNLYRGNIYHAAIVPSKPRIKHDTLDIEP